MTIIMSKAKVSKIVWIIALITGAVAVLGEYGWITVKWFTHIHFEILLVGFCVLILGRLFKI